jgi:hypothetical protein
MLRIGERTPPACSVRWLVERFQLAAKRKLCFFVVKVMAVPRNGFRRAAENSTRAACAPRILRIVRSVREVMLPIVPIFSIKVIALLLP